MNFYLWIRKKKNLSRSKYEFLKNSVINACKKLTDKRNLRNSKNLKNLKLLMERLNPVEKNINFQDDNDHCGVHLFRNVRNFLEEKETFYDEKFNPIQYRLEIIDYIIKNSDDVENICPKCGVKLTEFTIIHNSIIHVSKTDNSFWCQCERCSRWWHSDCAKELKTYDAVFERFICVMCRDLPLSSHNE